MLSANVDSTRIGKCFSQNFWIFILHIFAPTLNKERAFGFQSFYKLNVLELKKSWACLVSAPGLFSSKGF